MKIAFFTENSLPTNVPGNFPNSRTDIAWQIALKSDHWQLGTIPDVSDKFYDIGIVIFPKRSNVYTLEPYRKFCKKIGVMQEGPNWNWQDLPMHLQVSYFNALQDSDFLLCHNLLDVKYFSGLLTPPKHIFKMPTLMNEWCIDKSKIVPAEERSGVIVGGNMASWYGGFDSMVVAQQFGEPISVVSMGRKREEEEIYFPDVKYIPYMVWNEWIYELSKYKYAVHLMRTHAAGTFALNCAYLGIPCIGYNGLDTQEQCHSTSVEMGDLQSAIQIAQKLKHNPSYYEDCCLDALFHYSKYSLKEFQHSMKEKFKLILNQ